MVRYTEHPIADIGVATIAAFCGKTDPSSLAEKDLAKTAKFLEQEYFSGKLLSYLTCVFPNSAYVQPGAQPGAKVKMRREKIDEFKRHVLYGFLETPDPKAAGLRCAFSGEHASRIVYRQHVPLVTGEDVLNFFPAGSGGLPISGKYLLAVQAFPMGARRCHGRALAVHSPDDHDLTYAFASRFLSDNRKLLPLAEKSGEKYLDAKAPKTPVVSVFVEIENARRDNPDVLEMIEKRVRDGDSVIVVCNTVETAAAVHGLLREQLKESEVPVELLHSRFNARDRFFKEERLLDRLGTRSRNQKAGPAVLVATQVVEVSLDIDFDTIFTEPAPLESLVQRFGRVNRGRRRPSCDVHVLKAPMTGQGVYADNYVASALRTLEAHDGGVIDESQVGPWLDEIYAGTAGEVWSEEVKHCRDEFTAACLSDLRAFQPALNWPRHLTACSTAPRSCHGVSPTSTAASLKRIL